MLEVPDPRLYRRARTCRTRDEKATRIKASGLVSLDGSGMRGARLVPDAGSYFAR